MTRRRFSPAVYARIIEDQGGVCACGCGEPLGTDPVDINYDHCIPLWNGGEDAPENLAALIKGHHLAKTSREAKERAKMKRIAARDGLLKRRMTARDRVLAQMLEKG